MFYCTKLKNGEVVTDETEKAMLATPRTVAFIAGFIHAQGLETAKLLNPKDFCNLVNSTKISEWHATPVEVLPKIKCETDPKKSRKMFFLVHVPYFNKLGMSMDAFERSLSTVRWRSRSKEFYKGYISACVEGSVKLVDDDELASICNQGLITSWLVIPVNISPELSQEPNW